MNQLLTTSDRSGDATIQSSAHHDFVQGAKLTRRGVRYRIWTERKAVKLIVYRPDGSVARQLPMEPLANEFFGADDEQGKAGDLYKYEYEGSPAFPDPASRYQPTGVHGPSMVVNNDFVWSDDGWCAPSLPELIVYELHVGTFTQQGTFASAAQKLDRIAELGVNAIEIMPVADFPGERNWGYDGVCIYAPARVYGTPNELRALVDAAHRTGLAVILDVVYNHFGPDGNYLGAFHSEYFNSRHQTPWGAGLNFESGPVRQFFLHNVAYWMDEFHIDGFRLDATHVIQDESDVHILTEISQVVHQRRGFVIAEDDRNDPHLLTPPGEGGIGVDAAWADDFHHVVNVMLTGNRDAYFKNYKGSGEELATTLEQGWLFTGQVQQTTGKPRGGDPSSLRPEQFICCISNHDQVGNRAFGERLSHLVSPAAYRSASALFLLSPYTPLLFMGQEWAASSPFQYFTDHNAELGEKIIVGRRREFRDFAAFRDPAVRQSIPSPQAIATFERSKLNWTEREDGPNRRMLQLYRACLELRRTVPSLRDHARDNWKVLRLAPEVVAIVYGLKTSAYSVVVADLTGASFSIESVAEKIGVARELQTIFSSNEHRFVGDSEPGNKPQTTLLQVE